MVSEPVRSEGLHGTLYEGLRGAHSRGRAGTTRSKNVSGMSAVMVLGAVLASLGNACKSTPATPDSTAKQLQCQDGAASIPGHRSQSVICSITRIAGTDGGVDIGSCSSNADCTGTVYPWCLAGQCHVDQCLGDSDCAPGTACECGVDYTDDSDGAHINSCVPAQCRTDSDCGSGGLCSPSRTGNCGASGFYCHTSADTCISDSDCCEEPNAPNCFYVSTLGHWACVGLILCSG